MKKFVLKYLGSDDRTRNVRKNTIFMFLVRGMSILISLLYVPLLLSTLSTDRYGVWLIVTSLVSWVSLMDAGLGNGLRNKLVIALANNNYLLGRQYISSAYIALGLFMGMFCLVFVCTSWFLPWQKILNTTDIPNGDLVILVEIVFISFSVQFVLNLINSILFAFQKPALVSLLSMLGLLFSYVGLLIAVYLLHVNDLIILSAIISLAPVLVLSIFSFCFFTSEGKNYRPSLRYVDFSKIKDILNLGAKFFILQIFTLILFQTNNIIIAQSVDPAAVVEYNIAHKYTFVLITVFTIIVTPIWSAVTDAYTRGDFHWIKKTHYTLLKICFLLLIVGILMLLFSSFFYDLWLGKGHIQISIWTTTLLVVYAFVRMVYSCYGYIINGMGKLHAQMVITSVIAVTYIPLTYYSGVHYGLIGVLVANISVCLINSIWSAVQYYKVINGCTTPFWNK